MTPEQQAAAAIDSAATVDDARFAITGAEAVEAISAAGLCIVTAGRIAELLDANTALVEERRRLNAGLDAMTATIDAQGEALVALRNRVAAAEAARDDAKRQAGEMLPRRLEAERQRDVMATAAAMLSRRDSAEISALRRLLGLNPDPNTPTAAAPAVRSME
jgi:hypothetical protein